MKGTIQDFCLVSVAVFLSSIRGRVQVFYLQRKEFKKIVSVWFMVQSLFLVLRGCVQALHLAMIGITRDFAPDFCGSVFLWFLGEQVEVL